MNEKTFLVVGAISAFLAVALGAFGAHGLRARLSPEMLSVFETGVRYQMYHALALIGVSLMMAHWPQLNVAPSGWFFTAGTLLFSGSLYALTLTGIRTLGAVTPIGGVLFLLGWVWLVWSV